MAKINIGREAEFLRWQNHLAQLISEPVLHQPVLPLGEHLAQQRGKNSVQNVLNVLAPLTIFNYLKTTIPGGRTDCHGVDIIGGLNKRRARTHLEALTFQVKSSPTGILHYRTQLMELFDLRNPIQVDSWLMENTHVLLNGQEPPDEILKEFIHQFRDIRQFHGGRIKIR